MLLQGTVQQHVLFWNVLFEMAVIAVALLSYTMTDLMIFVLCFNFIFPFFFFLLT